MHGLIALSKLVLFAIKERQELGKGLLNELP